MKAKELVYVYLHGVIRENDRCAKLQQFSTSFTILLIYNSFIVCNLKHYSKVVLRNDVDIRKYERHF